MVALGALAWAPAAQAQPSDTDAQVAQSLFQQARQLMSQRRFSEACPLFAESQRLDPGGGTLLNLAVCHEGEGKTATAWSEFNESLSLALKDGRRDREQLSRQRIAVLEPALSHVTVVVPPPSDASGLTVSVDGVALSRPAWGVATAVDPGTHKVEAQAPGRQTWGSLVVLGGNGDAKRIEVPPLALMPVVTVGPPNPSAGPSPYPAAGQKGVANVSVPSKSPWRYFTGALGIAGLATSAVTGYLALHDHGIVSDNCNTDRNYCPNADYVNTASEARTWAWVSTISLGAGATGVVLFLLWPRDTVPLTVGVAPAQGGGAVVARGAL